MRARRRRCGAGLASTIANPNRSREEGFDVNTKAITTPWPDDDVPDDSPAPPRTSMFRLARPRTFEGDPRAVYTRALLNMARAGDIAHLLAPTEIFEAFCEAVAEPLDLVVAVLIDSAEGLPRSIPWKAQRTDWRVVESGERRAWSYFAELLAPDLLAVLPPDSGGPPSRPVHWKVQTLALPLLGIVQCGTSRPLGGADNGLLKCMSVKLSTTLGRAR
jgi:hypothetical protein